jgi:hypothetical protein
VHQEPWGLGETNLLVRAEAGDIGGTASSASRQEVHDLYNHAKSYFDCWGRKAVLRNNIKNLGIFVLGPEIVGMWQRSKFRDKMAPRFEQVRARIASSGPSFFEI